MRRFTIAAFPLLCICLVGCGRGDAPAARTAADPAPAPADWLKGTTEERFARIERHLRGLDVAMAEIAYRYGELLSAGKSRNWEYAQYQTEKIDLSLRLAVERRPKRAKSSQPFLDESLPPVLAAIKAKDGGKLDFALEKLHTGCVQCHKAENVLHFKEAVDRIKAQAQSTTAVRSGIDDTLRRDSESRFGIIAAIPARRLADADVTLGQALFWDARLSGSGKIACASCHLAQDGGADRRRFSADAKGKDTARNSQTVFNAVLQPNLRWTGDRKSGAHQAERSLTGSMGFASADAVIPLLKEMGYGAAFRAAFAKDPEPVSPANYGAAIQAYEATLATPAPFDRFLSGDDAALTATQKAGLRSFLSKGCADCHEGALLGGASIRKFGIAKDYWTATKSERKDAGLFEATKKEEDLYRFRVSMLRNISRTAPYFHDGSVAGLSEAVQVMADVQLGRRLAEEEVVAIVAFLESLAGDTPKNYCPPKTGAAGDTKDR